MSGTNKNTKAIIRRILSDIRVELGDEFDRNFERQAFFNDAWARRKSPTRPGGTILVDTGTLRRSIRSRTTDDRGHNDVQLVLLIALSQEPDADIEKFYQIMTDLISDETAVVQMLQNPTFENLMRLLRKE